MTTVKRRGMTVAMLAGVLLLAAACTGAADPAETGELPGSGGGGLVAVPGSGGGEFSPSALSGSGFVPVGYTSQQLGIWVSGVGTVTVVPDLAALNLGVEAQEKTAQEAQSAAAAAMTRLMAALKEGEVPGKDIQTRYFSIQPQYNYREVTRCPGESAPAGTTAPSPSVEIEVFSKETEGCYRTTEQVLEGYRVSNTVTVKVRNLENAGSLIDKVAVAGGDLTRINGISLTVDDPDQYAAQAREAAVTDALAKAQTFAELMGVTLGKLAYIAESGGSVPPVHMDYGMVRAEAAPAPPTPISAGETEVRVSVQAVFGIA